MKKIILGLVATGLCVAGLSIASANSSTCTVSSTATLAPKTNISNQFQNGASVNFGGTNYTSSNPVALEGCLYALVATSNGQNVKLYFNPIDDEFIGSGPAN